MAFVEWHVLGPLDHSHDAIKHCYQSLLGLSTNFSEGPAEVANLPAQGM